MITEWTRQVQAERQAAYAQLDTLGGISGGTTPGQRRTESQIKALVDGLGGMAILCTADPDDRPRSTRVPRSTKS